MAKRTILTPATEKVEAAIQADKKRRQDEIREQEKAAGDVALGMLRKGWILKSHLADFKKDVLSIIQGG